MIRRQALSIKEMAHTLRYPFIGTICAYLTEACDYGQYVTPRHLALIREITALLQLAFKSRIMGEGGTAGQDLAFSLRTLSHKIGQLKLRK